MTAPPARGSPTRRRLLTLLGGVPAMGLEGTPNGHGGPSLQATAHGLVADPMPRLFAEFRALLDHHEAALAACDRIEATLAAQIGYPRVALPPDWEGVRRHAADAGTVTENRQEDRDVMDETGGLSLWPLLGIAVVAAVAAWDLAKRKGLNQRRWAATCFFFAPALIGLALAKSRQRPGDTQAFRNRWDSLAAYDPEVKAAVDRLAALGPAAGEGPAPEVDPGERLAALHRRGALTDADYADQKRRLAIPRKPKSRWSGWWWKAPVALLLVWAVWPRGATGFPTCDARAARELVRSAIEGADDNRQVNRKLLALDGVRELSADLERRDRSCSGTAVLNLGEREIVWRMYARGDRVIANVSGF